MIFRNHSPQEMFLKMALACRPECRFPGGGRNDFERWKEETLPKVLETLGAMPPKCPPNPEFVAEWMHDGVRKQRWLLDVNPWLSAVLDVNYPPGQPLEEKRPAILVCVGHDRANGRKGRMGNAAEQPEPNAPVPHAAYGHHLAKAGFVTFAVDWLGMGDLNDSNKPNFRSQDHGRDWCNLYYLHATILGMTSLSLNIAHARAATDFALTLPGVDPDALGIMGSSGGGAMTVWISLCDERFKAVEVIGYSDLFTHFGFRDANYCGMQITPGLFRLVDVPDLQGLLAPTPLLVDIGARDECFRLESAMECFRRVEAIYRAAGVPELLELDLHPGGHTWGGNRSAAFFRRHLSFGG